MKKIVCNVHLTNKYGSVCNVYFTYKSKSVCFTYESGSVIKNLYYNAHFTYGSVCKNPYVMLILHTDPNPYVKIRM